MNKKEDKRVSISLKGDWKGWEGLVYFFVGKDERFECVYKTEGRSYEGEEGWRF